MNPVAFITGASRGIGKAVAHKLASEGWDIVVAAKSVEEHPSLPGTIFSAAEELEQHGTRILPVQCNVVQDESVADAARQTLDAFGRIDAVINNAGALWWKNMDETPMKRFDLVVDVNVRGAFSVTSAFLETMKAQKSGHILNMSPPVDMNFIPGHIAYCVGKFGMTFMIHGLAEELAEYSIHATALWPATLIESQATINHAIGTKDQWRSADIMADAVHEILQHPAEANGRAVFDEDFLRECGYEDFDRYACVPGGTPTGIRIGKGTPPST